MSDPDQAPYVIVRSISGEVAIYELHHIDDGIPVYANPVSTEIRTATFAQKVARRLTSGAALEQEQEME